MAIVAAPAPTESMKVAAWTLAVMKGVRDWGGASEGGGVQRAVKPDAPVSLLVPVIVIEPLVMVKVLVNPLRGTRPKTDRTKLPDSLKVPGKGPAAVPLTEKLKITLSPGLQVPVNVEDGPLVTLRVSPASDGVVTVALSESVAVAAGFLLVAIKVAVPALVAVGANCTSTVHESPGSRTVAVHMSLVAAMANVEEPSRVITGAAGAPPVFVSVNVCATVFPSGTDPKSYGDGENVSTGGPDAALAPSANASAAAATHKTAQPRPRATNQTSPRAPLKNMTIAPSPISARRWHLNNTATLPRPRRVRQPPHEPGRCWRSDRRARL
jgi:hypothetical protein